MGYNTRFTLKVELLIAGKLVELLDDTPFMEVIAQLRENEEAAYVLAPDGSASESGKWYECEADLRQFSLKHPALLFTLHGIGEDNEDIWNLYVMDGKGRKEKAVLTIAPFDAAKLA